MKSRISFDCEPKMENILGVAFLMSLAWFFTTLLIHDLIKRMLGLPADAGYRDGREDMMSAVMLPFFAFVPLILSGAFIAAENLWRRRSIRQTRVIYGALSLALLFWCWWSLRVSLSYGYGNRFHGYAITDTIQAAAYASICFPFALACACLLLSIMRRAPAQI